MSWDRSRANARIEELIKSIPTTEVTVERFADQYFPRRLQERAMSASKGESSGSPIVKLPYRKAVLVEGVHVYANLINYDNLLVSNDVETESSHASALQFLHLHYSVCDALVREFDLQRVDYHGGRMHAVVVTPTGPDNANARAVKAVAFAEALDRLIRDVSTSIAGGRFGAQLRVGIDCGPAVAINSGRGIESEPLFLGNPANYAAKLADGDSPGLFLSDRLRHDLNEAPVGNLGKQLGTAMESALRNNLFDRAQVEGQVGRASTLLAGDIGLREVVGPNAVFHFHYHCPPLRSLQFSELMPSRSVRMPMLAVYADLDGFTQYVSDSIASNSIPEMVARIHIMRGEMTNVLRDDFGGKKVRYIGDCLQGILAEGTATAIDEVGSIEKAIGCVAAIRSSFLLCDHALGASTLGVGIGFEFGEMPVTRLGHRGEMSVRCATGRATSAAEREQRRCNGVETAIGEIAYQRGSARVKSMFTSERKMQNLLYEDAVEFLDTVPVTPVVVTQPRIKAPPLRAHGRS